MCQCVVVWSLALSHGCTPRRNLKHLDLKRVHEEERRTPSGAPKGPDDAASDPGDAAESKEPPEEPKEKESKSPPQRVIEPHRSTFCVVLIQENNGKDEDPPGPLLEIRPRTTGGALGVAAHEAHAR